MEMKLRFCESEIGYWANLYTEGQREQDREREQQVINLNSKIWGCGSVTQDELYKVAYWKSHRSAHWINRNSDDFVREITRNAFTANNDWAKLMTLTALQGVKEPIASTILHLYDEGGHYPILDVHEIWAVGLEWQRGRTSFPFWLEYIQFCRDIADHNNVSMRDLNRALWKFSSDYSKTKRPR